MRPFVPLLLSLIGVCLIAHVSSAQDQPASVAQKATYPLKYVSPRTLAPVLAQHFKGAAEIQVAPEAPENSLLISAEPAVLKEVADLLERLDHRKRYLEVDLWAGVVRDDGLTPKAAEGAPSKPGAAARLAPRDFSGPLAEVLLKLDALKASGRLAKSKHFQASVVDENQLLNVDDKERILLISGMATSPTGKSVKITSFRVVGLGGKMVFRVLSDDLVSADVDLNYSRARDGELLGMLDGLPVHATELPLAHYRSKVLIPGGSAVALQTVAETNASAKERTLFVIWARAVDPGALKAK
jgi:hypothetical protein